MKDGGEDSETEEGCREEERWGMGGDGANSMYRMGEDGGVERANTLQLTTCERTKGAGRRKQV